MDHNRRGHVQYGGFGSLRIGMGGACPIAALQGLGHIPPAGIVRPGPVGPCRIEDDAPGRVGQIHLHVHTGLGEVVDAGGKGALVHCVEGGGQLPGLEAAGLHGAADERGQDMGLIHQHFLHVLHEQRTQLAEETAERVAEAEGGQQHVGQEDARAEFHGSSRRA